MLWVLDAFALRAASAKALGRDAIYWGAAKWTSMDPIRSFVAIG